MLKNAVFLFNRYVLEAYGIKSGTGSPDVQYPISSIQIKAIEPFHPGHEGGEVIITLSKIDPPTRLCAIPHEPPTGA